VGEVSRLSSADTPTADVEAAEEPVDTARQELVERLTTALGDGVVESVIDKGDVWVRVRVDAWRAAAEACRSVLAMDYFCFLSGIDWMPSTQPNPEESVETVIEGEEGDEAEAQAEAEPEAEAEPAAEAAAPAADGWTTGVAGGDTRFQVLLRLYSTTTHLGITLKADLDDADPRVATISTVYGGADWHERETWEMFGFSFEGHPNLTHLYLPSEFEGFPLRKDFPLLAREVKPWPGIVDVETIPEALEARLEAAVAGPPPAPDPARGGETP
jgi:NADH-quinone oxidoreductase subunit C